MEIVSELISRGADLNTLSGPFGTTLAVAVWCGDEECFCPLLDHGADVNLGNGRGKRGFALEEAINKDYYTMAHELLDRGADVKGPGQWPSH
jgi:ankyrin repeat protein